MREFNSSGEDSKPLTHPCFHFPPIHRECRKVYSSGLNYLHPSIQGSKIGFSAFLTSAPYLPEDMYFQCLARVLRFGDQPAYNHDFSVVTVLYLPEFLVLLQGSVVTWSKMPSKLLFPNKLNTILWLGICLMKYKSPWEIAAARMKNVRIVASLIEVT